MFWYIKPSVLPRDITVSTRITTSWVWPRRTGHFLSFFSLPSSGLRQLPYPQVTKSMLTLIFSAARSRFLSVYSLLFQKTHALQACLENMSVLLKSILSFAYPPKVIPTTSFSNIPPSFQLSLLLFYLLLLPPLLAPPFPPLSYGYEIVIH